MLLYNTCCENGIRVIDAAELTDDDLAFNNAALFFITRRFVRHWFGTGEGKRQCFYVIFLPAKLVYTLLLLCTVTLGSIQELDVT